jgi:hypothetical protein
MGHPNKSATQQRKKIPLRAFGRNEKMGLFSGISVIISERS